MSDLLQYLSLITQEAGFLGLILTAGVILTGRDWRTLIMALLIQYILLGYMLYGLVPPDIAILKVMIGAFVCPVLFLSARQIALSGLTLPQIRGRSWRTLSMRRIAHRLGRTIAIISPKFVFRLLLVLIVVLIAIALRDTFPLPNLPRNITAAIYWLVLAGLTTMTLTEDPMKVGHALFTTLNGFDLYYTTLETSLLITGLWGTVNLLTALVIGYLIVAKGAAPEETL